MDRRDFNANGKARSTRGRASARLAQSAVNSERAQLRVECTRAVLRAGDEAMLAATLCQLLVRPGGYGEACFALTCQGVARSFYAGADRNAFRQPERFWVSRK